LFKRIKILLLAVYLLGLAQVGAAQLAPAVQPGQLDINNSNAPRDVRQAQVPAPRISERQAIDLARQQFAGNVLRISLIAQGNSLIYQIRMENDGRVFTVFVDAMTGAVSGG